MDDQGLEVLLALAKESPNGFRDLLMRVFEVERLFEADDQRELAQQRVSDLVGAYASEYASAEPR